MIEGLKPSQAIALGTLRPDLPDEIPIVSKKNLNGGEAIARVQENIIYRKNNRHSYCWTSTKAMPDECKSGLASSGRRWLRSYRIKRSRAPGPPVNQCGLYRTDTNERIEVGWHARLRHG